MTADVAIAGAGIAGAACAYYLAREGVRVAIVEPGIVGGGATAAGMGHLLVLDDNEAEFALTRYSRELWNGLAAELPREVEYDRTGTLWVAADDEEMAVVRQKHSYFSARSVAAEILDAVALAEAEPNLCPGMAGGLLLPEDALVYSPRAALWLLEQAVASGALLVRTAVSAFEQDRLRLTNGDSIEAKWTICASGAWAAELVPGLAMQPRKGHLAITDRYPGFVRHALIELGYIKSAHGNATESVAFNAQPRRTGQVLIGSSRQFGVTHAGIDTHMVRRMLARAVSYMPGIARLSVVRTWTGFRAATADKLPIIGPCADRERTFVATGHEGIGITTSLGTACLLRDMILGRAPAIDPSPFSPLRFAGSVA